MPYSFAPDPRQSCAKQTCVLLASTQLVAVFIAGAAASNHHRRSHVRSADGSSFSRLSRSRRPDIPRSAGSSHAEARGMGSMGRPATAPESPHLSMHHALPSASSVHSPSGDSDREAFLCRMKSFRSGQEPEVRSREVQPAARSSRWDEAPCHPAASSDAGDDEVAILSPHQFEAEAAARAGTALSSNNLSRCDAIQGRRPDSVVTSCALPNHAPSQDSVDVSMLSPSHHVFQGCRVITLQTLN